MSQRIAACFRTYLHCQRGVAMIEFALIFPFFFVLLFGGIEVTRLLLIQQRLERAGYVLADITTQYSPATAAGRTGEITVAEVTNNVFPQLTRIMGEYGNLRDQAIILTSVHMVNGEPRIKWQIASRADTLTGCDTRPQQTCVESVVNGANAGSISPAMAGQVASFKNDTGAAVDSLADGTNFIVSEVFYRYRPILQQLLQNTGKAGGEGMVGFDFYLPERFYAKRTFFMPRNGAMLYLPPDFPVP